MKPLRLEDLPPIRGRQVWTLAEVEYDRWAQLVASLGPQDWRRPTDCTDWDVRALCLHLLGTLEGQASPPELLRQFALGLPRNRRMASNHWVDGVNAQQIHDRRDLPDDAIGPRTLAAAPRAVRGRRRTPPPVRWTPVPFGPPVGWKPLTYLLHMGFTRDVWMHRVDLARAVDRPLQVTVEHDGRIIADIAREWAATHHLDVHLVLTGPAGGRYVAGTGAEQVEVDAVELTRILSGRAGGEGVLGHPLPL